MKIYINETQEILNVSSVTERLRQGVCALDININDSQMSLEELNTLFADNTTIKVVRIDLNGDEKIEVITDYPQIDRIQRRLVDETDITTVSLVKASTRANATETEIAN